MSNPKPSRKARVPKDRRATLLQIAVHVAALIPLALLIWDGLHGHLTADPIRNITLRTGKTALVLLILSLVCTPASALLGLRAAIRWRRPLGMYAFLYISLHFLTFTVLDYGLDPALLREALFEKRYALAGFSAFVLLVPLAVTSTKGWMRRLGKRWKRLHTLVYPAVLVAIVHYIWLVKGDIRVPLMYGAVVVVLLFVRIPAIKKAIARLRGPDTRPPGVRARSAVEAPHDVKDHIRPEMHI